MDPRLESSKQWSLFPIELCDQICEVFTERFADEYDLRGMHFIAEGRIFREEVVIRVGLSSNNLLKQYNFELSVTIDPPGEKVTETIQQAIDLLEPSFVDLLEEGFTDFDFPRLWQALPNTKKLSAYLRYSTINSKLEQEADVLLEQYEKRLFYGEDLPEEPNDNVH